MQKQQKELQRRAAEKAAKAAEVEAAKALLAHRKRSLKTAQAAARRLLRACEKAADFNVIHGQRLE